MAEGALAVEIVGRYPVSPPPNTVPPTSLPLTFFDIPWLFFSPTQPLFFYDYPYPTSHFLSTALPPLIHSLSLTLRHFFALVATLVCPPHSSNPPFIVYDRSNFVSLVVAQSTADFHHLYSNHQRCVNDFYPLIPPLPSGEQEETQTLLLAAQITIFSNVGVCIGFAYRNVVADGRSFNSFIKTWASLFRDPSSCSINSSLLPFYDRTSIFLNQLSKRRSSTSMVIGVSDSDLDSAMVRATFLMCPDDMEKIKGWIVGRCKVKNMDQPPRLTPSNLTWAYVWVCLIKSHEKVNGKLTGTNPSYFGFNAGGTTRLGYPVHAAYIGNLHWLSGEDGIIVAADAIGNRVKDLGEAFLEGAENWISVRGTDFGWGKARKIEEISMDNAKGKAVWFTQSRDVKGGIEVGLALPKPKMDAFTCFFTQLLPHH
ncbi:hypothetical protein ES332_A08G172200v1 [Gossypium tomentosum]|uniref:Uncharacterized protein n=1 Tax=Gossypium tomentosum TaxID=34277 RepID=A0A5D2PH41_GOSTO|nr:hypothetical protein ES332_A08G172200v1 [Gossypium tomentosum]